MKGFLIGAVFIPLAFAIAFQIDSAKRDHAEVERNRQEQQVASWERDQFNGSISKAARTCAAVRVRCSAPWLVLEGQMVPGGPWVELGRARASVYEGEP